MKKIIITALLLWFVLSLPALAQEPELMRGVGRLNQIEVKGEGRNLLFVIGIDEYQKWFRLKNAVSDARGIQAVFMEKYGFQPALAPLFDEQATRDNIKGHLDALREKLEPDDNLVIFFAGHGETRVDTVGSQVVRAGFIIPADGEALSDGGWSSYISLQEFMSEIARLPPRHITLILDACHSGIALDDDAEQFRGNEAAPPAALVNAISRRVITSARGNELASDKGPVGNHSLFTGMLIEGLKTGKADLDGDNFITSTEIGLYLQRSVSSYSGNLQTPDFGVFQLDQRGDMVLSLDANTAAILATNALNLWYGGKTEDYIATFEKLQEVDTTFLDFQILKYYYGLIKGDIDLALMALAKWEKMVKERYEGETSRTKKALVHLARAGLEHWQGFLGPTHPAASFLEVELFQDDKILVPEPVAGRRLRYLAALGKTFKLKVKNNGKQPVYIYALVLDAIGRVRYLNLWNDPKLIYGQGLAPGEAAVSCTFSPPAAVGAITLRMFVSTEPVPAFLVPPDESAVNIKAIPYEGTLNINTLSIVFD